jgi:hypothetical protein
MTTPLELAAEDLLRARPRIPPHAVHRMFPSETVVLNLNTGIYHGLNATAGRMLGALEKSPTVAAALAALARELPEAGDRLKSDLCDLCEQLASRGLLELLPPTEA